MNPILIVGGIVLIGLGLRPLKNNLTRAQNPSIRNPDKAKNVPTCDPDTNQPSSDSDPGGDTFGGDSGELESKAGALDQPDSE